MLIEIAEKNRVGPHMSDHQVTHNTSYQEGLLTYKELDTILQ